MAFQKIRIQCPGCGTTYEATVNNVLDIDQDPQAKERLLLGLANIVICPQCGTGGVLNLPLVYHDREKELLLCYIPTELDMNEMERQQLIGRMTNEIIERLPTEQRKAYLLQPEIFLTLPSLVRRVLNADGITDEMIERQERQLQLLRQLIESGPGTEIETLLQENLDLVDDRDFVVNIGIALSQAQKENDEPLAERLTRAQQWLYEHTSAGQEIQRVQEKINALNQAIEQAKPLSEIVDAFLDLAQTTPQEWYEDVLTVYAPLWTYPFLLEITRRAETRKQEGKTELAQKILQIREWIVTFNERIRREQEKELRAFANLLDRWFNADDPKAFAQQHAKELLNPRFSGFFFALTEASNEDNVQLPLPKAKLGQLRAILIELFEQHLPPEQRLLYQLFNAPGDPERRKILEENAHMVTEEWIQRVEEILQEAPPEHQAAYKRITSMAREMLVKAKE